MKQQFLVCYNATNVYEFKAKKSEIRALCFGKVSKNFTINNMKAELKGVSWKEDDIKYGLGQLSKCFLDY